MHALLPVSCLLDGDGDQKGVKVDRVLEGVNWNLFIFCFVRLTEGVVDKVGGSNNTPDLRFSSFLRASWLPASGFGEDKIRGLGGL